MELVIPGLAVGSIYALIAAGFALIFRGTAVMNFAHGSLVLVGGYTAYSVSSRDLPYSYVWGLLAAAVVTAAVAWGIQAGIFSRLRGLPLFAMFMITLGIDTVMFAVISGYRPWSAAPKEIVSPWGIATTELGPFRAPIASLWIIGITVVLVVALAVFLRRSRWGLAMQVTALDGELARILGISTGRVFAMSWGIAGALAAFAGVFLGTFPRLLEPATHSVALRAIPAAVLGGIDSVFGAGLGGLVIGLIEVFTAAYAPSWLGQGFHVIMPYVLMFVVLMVKPEGFFGTREREVERA